MNVHGAHNLIIFCLRQDEAVEQAITLLHESDQIAQKQKSNRLFHGETFSKRLLKRLK